MIECSFKIDEKRFQDLMEIDLRRWYNHTRIEIFREQYVGCSVADFIVFSPYTKGIIVVYELKMYWDKDYNRLKRQIKDYLSVADRVIFAFFGGRPKFKFPKEVTIIDVNIKNGWLNYDFGEKGMYIENDINNIDWKMRLRCIKNLRDLWKRKTFYAEKIIGYTQRKIIRLEKKKVT